MFRRTVLSLVVLLGTVLVCGVVEAEQRGPRSGRVRLFQPSPPVRPLDQQQGYQLDQSPRSRYSYWRDIYPQFYGGFHYRQIYEFGPPGDFGFRGSPW
jgi:hypothetical protein